jgi:hypothetical protein
MPGIKLDKSERIIDYAEDETRIYALIHKGGPLETGDFFVVLRQGDNGKWERFYENDFTSRKPWKLETADIDGDGEKEILTAVKKTTLFDPVEKNRMFIFNFNGEKLYKKWTGSQIAGSWKDFIAGDAASAPGEELVFIEQTEDNKAKISIYSWFDFGFFLIASRGNYEDIQGVIILGENRIEITCREERRTITKTLRISEGKLIEAK